ncbi:two-component regulator propeller domain-containing protein, partial [Klebsiella pneumoniae]|uniref:two-component regulator propeller domain-containing protein n=1 Tax=Klebsiella pneumoniae TaxID=573 RepID=UPI00338FCC49
MGPLTEEVNGLCKDKDGNIWISTRGHGVCRYGVRTGTLEQFGFPDCGDNISTVYVDNSNQVWALTNWGSPILSRLNTTTDTFEEYVLMDNGRKLSEGGLVLLEDSEQRFWLGTWTDGLYEIDRITGH